MAVSNYAPGKIKPILYFENKNGIIKILPSDEETHRFRKHMRKLGFEMMAAETLKQAQKLQYKMQEQLKKEMEFELAKDEAVTHHRRQAIKDRLTARMNSAACNSTEREFIRLWLYEREHKHDIFRKRFTDQVGHLDALEFDNLDERISDMMDRVPNSGQK